MEANLASLSLLVRILLDQLGGWVGAPATTSLCSCLTFLASLALQCRMHRCWASGLAPQVNDKRVTFAPETKSSTASATVPDNWGFRFVVEPLRGVRYRVVRELELICRFGGRVRSGSGPSTAGTTFGPQVRHRNGITGVVDVSKCAIFFL